MAAVDLTRLLALGDDGAVAGGGEESRDAGPAGTQALGQGALRVEFEFELSGQELPLEFLVLAHVGRNHLLDLPGPQQLAEAEAVYAGIVGDHRSEEHTSELQSLMRISYAVFCLKKKNTRPNRTQQHIY